MCYRVGLTLFIALFWKDGTAQLRSAHSASNSRYYCDECLSMIVHGKGR